MIEITVPALREISAFLQSIEGREYIGITTFVGTAMPPRKYGPAPMKKAGYNFPTKDNERPAFYLDFAGSTWCASATFDATFERDTSGRFCVSIRNGYGQVINWLFEPVDVRY